MTDFDRTNHIREAAQAASFTAYNKLQCHPGDLDDGPTAGSIIN